MTRSEAERLARANAREHPDRETHRWIANEHADGSWTVAKVRVPPRMKPSTLKATTEAKPKPPEPGDQRTNHDRNVGGPWFG